MPLRFYIKENLLHLLLFRLVVVKFCQLGVLFHLGDLHLLELSFIDYFIVACSALGLEFQSLERDFIDEAFD